MIVYEIYKKLPTAVQASGHMFQTWQQRKAEQDALRESQKDTPLVIDLKPQLPVTGNQRTYAWHRMSKLEYAQWLNEYVYGRGFRKGTICTIRSHVYVPGQMPPVWFKLSCIEEIHHMAMIDKEHGEPRALGLLVSKSGTMDPKGSVGLVFYPPSLVRICTYEEENLINDYLRGQTAVAVPETAAANESAATTDTASSDGGTGGSTEADQEGTPV